MEISYRRTSTSLLERALARLLKRRQVPAHPDARFDLVHNVDLEFRRA